MTIWSPEQAAAYLAAMIDGEGWVGEPKGPQNRAIRIGNTDFALIEATAACCDALGVTYSIYDRPPRELGWKPLRWIEIYGRVNLTRIWEVCPIQAPKKRDRLERTVASYRLGKSPGFYYEDIDLDELRRLYDAGLTQREVAARLGIGFKRVINAMRAHGIARRARGTFEVGSWQTRRERYGATGRSKPFPKWGETRRGNAGQ